MADELLGSLGIEIQADYSGLQPDIDAALSIARAGADKISSALAEALKTPDTAPVTEAFTKVAEAGTALASNLAGVLAVDLGTPDTSAFTDAIASLEPMAQEAAQGVAGDFGISLEAPDTSAVSDAVAATQDDATAAATGMADAFGVPLEAPDSAPVVDALGGVDDVAATSADQMAQDFGLPLEAPDASPVDQALAAVTETSVADAGEMADAFARPLETPDSSPVSDELAGVADQASAAADEMAVDFALPLASPDVSQTAESLDSVPAMAESAADEMAAATGVTLDAPEVEPVTSALDQVTDKSFETGTAVDELGAQVADLLASGEAATMLEALARAEAELADNAGAASGAVGPLADDIAGTGDAANAAGSAVDDLKDSVARYSDEARTLLERQAEADGELAKAQDVLGEVQRAYDAGEVSAAALARAGGELEKAFSSAHPEIKKAGQAASEADPPVNSLAGSLEQMGGSLLGLAGLSLTAAGIVELGAAALHASDEVGDATHSMGVLGGSAADAEVAIGKLKVIANDEGLSFPSLLTASVRMTNFLGSSQQVPAAIEAIGNVTTELGTSLDSAVNKFDMLASSGDISKKSLQTLGLTMGELAGALGTTESKAKDAFKALDEEERVNKLIDALGKFNGEAHILTDDTFGNLTRAGNELHEVLTQLGDDLEPLTKQISGLAVEWIPKLTVALREILTFGTYVLTGIKVVIDGVVTLVSVATEAIVGYAKAWKDLMTGNFDGAVQAAKDAFQNIKSASQFGWDSLIKDATDGGSQINGIWDKTKTAADDAAGGTKRLTAALETQLPVVGNVHKATRDFVDALGFLPSIEQEASRAALAHQASNDQLTTSLLHANENLETAATRYANAKVESDKLGISTPALEQATTALAVATKAQSDAQEKWNAAATAMPALPVDAFVQFRASMQEADNQLRNLNLDLPVTPALITPLNQALIDFKIKTDATHPSLTQLITDLGNMTGAGPDVVDQAIGVVSRDIQKLAQTDLPAAIKAQQEYIDTIKGLPGHYQEAERAEQKVLEMEIQLAHNRGEDASKYLISLDQLKNKINGPGDSLYEAYKDLGKLIGETFKGVQSAIADVIVDGKNMGDALEAVGKKIAKEFIEDVLKLAMKPLEDSLTKLAGTVFPSVAQGAGGAASSIGSLGSTAAGAAGQVGSLGGAASSASGAASSVGGAFGSLGGTINVVSGAVSAVTGVIGLFQNAAMHATEKLVEMNTRISAIVESKELPLSNQIAVEQEATLNSIWGQIREDDTNAYNRLGEIWSAVREVQNHIDLVGDGIYQLGHGQMGGATVTTNIDGATVMLGGRAIQDLDIIAVDANLTVEGIRNLAVDIQHLSTTGEQAAAATRTDFQGLFTTGVHIGNTVQDASGNIVKVYGAVQDNTTATTSASDRIVAMTQVVAQDQKALAEAIQSGNAQAIAAAQAKMAADQAALQQAKVAAVQLSADTTQSADRVVASVDGAKQVTSEAATAAQSAAAIASAKQQEIQQAVTALNARIAGDNTQIIQISEENKQLQKQSADTNAAIDAKIKDLITEQATNRVAMADALAKGDTAQAEALEANAKAITKQLEVLQQQEVENTDRTQQTLIENNARIATLHDDATKTATLIDELKAKAVQIGADSVSATHDSARDIGAAIHSEGDRTVGANRENSDKVVTSVHNTGTFIAGNADGNAEKITSSVHGTGTFIAGNADGNAEKVVTSVHGTGTFLAGNADGNADKVVASVHGTGEFIAGRNDTAESSTREHIGSRIDKLGVDLGQAVSTMSASIASSVERAGRDHAAAIAGLPAALTPPLTAAINNGAASINQNAAVVGTDVTGHIDSSASTISNAVTASADHIVTGVGAGIQALGASITAAQAAASAAANAAAAADLQARLVAGSPVRVTTVADFFSGEMIAHGQIPDWAQKVIDEVKALGTTIPLNLDAANRLTWINTDGTLGLRFWNQNLPKGGFDAASLAAGDTSFKQDPATWNAMIDALLASGSIQQMIDNLQANINFANANGAYGSGGVPPPATGGSGVGTTPPPTAPPPTTGGNIPPPGGGTPQPPPLLPPPTTWTGVPPPWWAAPGGVGGPGGPQIIGTPPPTGPGSTIPPPTGIITPPATPPNAGGGGQIPFTPPPTPIPTGGTASADQLAAAIQHEQDILNALKEQAKDLNTQLIIAAANGNETLVATINAKLSSVNGQITSQGSLVTGLLAQQNATAASAAAAAAAAAAAQIAAMAGSAATADQIHAAITNAGNTLANLKTEQSGLQQALLKAVAAGDTSLIAAIQSQLTAVNGQIGTTNSLLIQLNTIVATTPGPVGGGSGGGGGGGAGGGPLPGFFGVDPTRSLAEQIMDAQALIARKTTDMQYDFAAGNVATGQLLQREIAQLQAWIQANTAPPPTAPPPPTTPPNAGGGGQIPFTPPPTPHPGGLLGLPVPTGNGQVPLPPPGPPLANIPSFDAGGYVPRDMLAMVHAGEYVLPAIPSGTFRGGDTASYANNMSQSVTINVQASNNPMETAQALERLLRRVSYKFASN